MKKIWFVVVLLFLFCFCRQNVYSQAFETDIAGYGFTTGIAAKEIPAGQATQVNNHNIKIDIPQGTFAFPVTFEILQGQNSYFQSEAPTERIIITNFAFRVRNHTTNKLIGEFRHPILVTVILPDDAVNVEVWKVELTHPPQIVNNPGKSEIGDKTLLLQADSATTGWVITSSTNSLYVREEEEKIEENVDQPIPTRSLALPILGIIVIGAVVIFLIKR